MALISLDLIGLFLGLIVTVAYVILLALQPYRQEVLRPRREGFSAPLFGLAVLGAVPLLWYALTVAGYQRNGLPKDPHVAQGHWYVMGAMAIGIVLTAVLSSLKFRGWAITAWSAAGAVALYGLASVVYPRYPGAEGTGWGIAAIVGGLVFAGVAEWERRRSPRPLERIPA